MNRRRLRFNARAVHGLPVCSNYFNDDRGNMPWSCQDDDEGSSSERTSDYWLILLISVCLLMLLGPGVIGEAVMKKRQRREDVTRS